MQPAAVYAAFAGPRKLALGSLRDVLPVVKERFDRSAGAECVLVFELATGRQVDFDLRGSLDELLAREAPVPARGPGRPKLGVTSREVTLLPRHWAWLEEHPIGSSGALRRLLEEAMKAEPGKQEARRIRAALSGFLSSMAGDRPHFEEASRALFNDDLALFERHVRRWPKDIRELALDMAREAAAAAAGPEAPTVIVAELYRLVWSRGEYQALERLVAPEYVVHSDPGDPWEGQTLDRSGYRERVEYSRAAFPDLEFTIHEAFTTGDRVAVRWSAEGTHEGALCGLPASGKRLRFGGQTIYELTGQEVAGHWQLVDRLGVLEQVRD